MRLILIRHGETEENQKGILQGHLDGSLTKSGKEQAKKVAKRLKEEKIDAIFSSDLGRASDTAREIAKYHPDVPIEFVEELREKNQGSLTGKFIKDIDWSKPRDTEKKELMAKRAKIILDRAYKEYRDKTVLFVSHGGLIRVLTALIMNKPLESTMELGEPLNTGISVFGIEEDNNHKIILLNCGKHLD